MCDGEGDKVCERETEGVQDRGRGQKEGVRKTRREKRKKKTDYFWYVCREERVVMHHAHVLCAAHL